MNNVLIRILQIVINNSNRIIVIMNNVWIRILQMQAIIIRWSQTSNKIIVIIKSVLTEGVLIKKQQ